MTAYNWAIGEPIEPKSGDYAVVYDWFANRMFRQNKATKRATVWARLWYDC